MPKRDRRLFTLGPENEPRWVCLYIHRIDDRWVAMLIRMADDESPPEPGTLKGIALFGATPEEAEREAKAYLGVSEPVN